jgi:hypothetical protein
MNIFSKWTKNHLRDVDSLEQLAISAGFKREYVGHTLDSKIFQSMSRYGRYLAGSLYDHIKGYSEIDSAFREEYDGVSEEEWAAHERMDSYHYKYVKRKKTRMERSLLKSEKVVPCSKGYLWELLETFDDFSKKYMSHITLSSQDVRSFWNIPSDEVLEKSTYYVLFNSVKKYGSSISASFWFNQQEIEKNRNKAATIEFIRIKEGPSPHSYSFVAGVRTKSKRNKKVQEDLVLLVNTLASNRLPFQGILGFSKQVELALNISSIQGDIAGRAQYEHSSTSDEAFEKKLPRDFPFRGLTKNILSSRSFYGTHNLIAGRETVKYLEELRDRKSSRRFPLPRTEYGELITHTREKLQKDLKEYLKSKNHLRILKFKLDEGKNLDHLWMQSHLEVYKYAAEKFNVEIPSTDEELRDSILFQDSEIKSIVDNQIYG